MHAAEDMKKNEAEGACTQALFFFPAGTDPPGREGGTRNSHARSRRYT